MTQDNIYLTSGRKNVIRMLLMQVLLVLLLTVIAGFFSDKQAAYSAFFGGGICFIGFLIFAIKVFATIKIKTAKTILRDFYFAEVFKIFISILLFVVVFLSFEINPIAFFLSYIIVQMVVWFTPLIFKEQITVDNT